VRSLQIEQVSKHFQGVVALSAVDLEVRPAEVLGLIGPNGAGKTTLVNVITGHLKPDSGTVSVGDQKISGLRMETIARHGVARTFQHLRLVDEMTVFDNVLSGRHLNFRARPWRVGALRREDRTNRDAARDLIARLELADVAAERASSLPYGMRRRVEIARTLAMEPSVLLLDEPTAGMTAADAQELGELLQRTSRDGIAVLLIEHNVKLVTAVCDRLAVLDWGKLIKTGTPAEVWSDAVVRAAYLGTEDEEAPSREVSQ
jgi:ABC-type branched-subunit amino acid transport system ATPase component